MSDGLSDEISDEDFSFETVSLSEESGKMVDRVINTLMVSACGLLLILITRDYGIVTSSTIFSGCYGFYTFFRTKSLSSTYGYLRRSSDNILNMITPTLPEKPESPVLMSKIESSNTETKEKWEKNFPCDDIMTMIQDEDNPVTLKIRFKNGCVKVVKINA
tara:strand:+ start:11683 stop:12165 length:483 start_codon:yes stop_codon:yes gene_type:complete